MRVRDIDFTSSALSVAPSIDVLGKGNPKAGRTEFVHLTQSFLLDVYTDTGQQVCFTFSGDARTSLTQASCDGLVAAACFGGSLTKVAYAHDATSRVFAALTCDQTQVRDLDVENGLAVPGQAGEDDLLVRRDGLIEVDTDAGWVKQHLLILGSSLNELRTGNTVTGSTFAVYPLNLGTGDAGLQGSTLLGTWELPHQPHITHLAVVGLLKNAGSTTLYSGIIDQSNVS